MESNTSSTHILLVLILSLSGGCQYLPPYQTGPQSPAEKTEEPDTITKSPKKLTTPNATEVNSRLCQNGNESTQLIHFELKKECRVIRISMKNGKLQSKRIIARGAKITKYCSMVMERSVQKSKAEGFTCK